MIRTQLYIDEKLYKELSLLAKETKEPMAQIARTILREGIQKKRINRSGKPTLSAIANLGFKGKDKSLSSNIDTILYSTLQNE